MIGKLAKGLAGKIGAKKGAGAAASSLAPDSGAGAMGDTNPTKGMRGKVGRMKGRIGEMRDRAARREAGEDVPMTKGDKAMDVAGRVADGISQMQPSGDSQEVQHAQIAAPAAPPPRPMGSGQLRSTAPKPMAQMGRPGMARRSTPGGFARRGR